MIEREDLSQGRITLLIFSNKVISGGISSYEVVNQITPETGDGMRGDVTLLIKGLPKNYCLIHHGLDLLERQFLRRTKSKENGTFARTTYQQYGDLDLLHAYTT